MRFQVFLPAVAMLVALSMTMACNSRPPYYRELWEFKTTCDGGLTARYERDPDPEVGKLTKLEEARFNGSTPDPGLVRLGVGEEDVFLASGKRCNFPGANIHSIVTCETADRTPADCQATWTLREWRQPTLDPHPNMPAEPPQESFEDLLAGAPGVPAS